MSTQGYRKYGKVVWVKTTEKGVPVNFIGKLQRHSTEKMVIFSKWDIKDFTNYHAMNDVLIAPFRGQSVKPKEMYALIKKLVKVGHYLEIFGRTHNIQSNYVSVGNQLRQK